MRSQIPRPDQRFGKIIKVSGQDVILADEVWYRYLTTEHSDTAVIEIETLLSLLAATPNNSASQKAISELRAALMSKRGENISYVLKRLSTLEALVLVGAGGGRSTGSGNSLSNSLTSAHIFIGSASNVATDTAMSGDATISNTGALTIANDAVSNAKLANMAAWTYKIRNDSSSGDPSDAALADFTTLTTPATGDFLVGFKSTGEIRKVDVGTISTVVSGAGTPGARGMPGGRITLTSNTPYLAATTTGAATVYYTPAVHDLVPIYDGTAWSMYSFNEVSQALSDTTKSPYAMPSNAIADMLFWNDSSTLRCTRSEIWSKTATVTTTVATPCVVTWTTHGLSWGVPVKFSVSGGVLPTGITSGTWYYVGGSTATVTMTLASPTVVTWTAHGLRAGDTISFSTTGALYTGVTAGTVYYVMLTNLAANTFQIAATPTGAAINTSGSQSGVHTGYGGQAPAANTFSISAAPGGNFIATTGSSTGTQTAIGGDYTARGTGAATPEVQILSGIPVNKYDVTNGPAATKGTVMGSVKTNIGGTIDFNIGGVGVSGGETSICALSNAFNEVQVSLTNIDSIASYTYNSSTVRTKNNSARNAIGVLRSFQRGSIDIDNLVVGQHSNGGFSLMAVIGVRSYSVMAVACTGGYDMVGATNHIASPQSHYTGIEALGYSFYTPLESQPSNTGTATWYGYTSGTDAKNSGFYVATTY